MEIQPLLRYWDGDFPILSWFRLEAWPASDLSGGWHRDVEPKPCRCQAALTDALGDVQGDERPRSPNGGAMRLLHWKCERLVRVLWEEILIGESRREAYCSVGFIGWIPAYGLFGSRLPQTSFKHMFKKGRSLHRLVHSLGTILLWTCPGQCPDVLGAQLVDLCLYALHGSIYLGMWWQMAMPSIPCPSGPSLPSCEASSMTVVLIFTMQPSRPTHRCFYLLCIHQPWEKHVKSLARCRCTRPAFYDGSW